MAKIPIKFKRVAAAFEEAVKRRPPCESSSRSEYWPPESGTDLSDLVNSFIEKGFDEEEEDQFNLDLDQINDDLSKDTDESDNEDNYTIRKELLRDLFLESMRDDDDDCGVKLKIRDSIEVALKLIGDYSDSFGSASNTGLKRTLMTHLRDDGFDAGLCKSRWDKTGRVAAGTYEYIDVNVGKIRYIIEVFPAREFEIARPTTQYTSLLGMFPSILIIEKPQVLKQIIRLMSAAMKDSLKHANMYVAPWRRNGYMQAKYLSPYKRTTNRTSGANNEWKGETKKRSTMVGFKAEFPRVSYYCRMIF